MTEDYDWTQDECWPIIEQRDKALSELAQMRSPMTLDHPFGESVRTERTKKKIPLRQLARSVVISSPYLSDIERGYRAATIEVAERIAEGLDSGWLVGRWHDTRIARAQAEVDRLRVEKDAWEEDYLNMGEVSDE